MYCLVSLNSTIHFFHDQINICEYEIYFHYNFNHFKANSLSMSVECLVTDGCSRYVSLFVFSSDVLRAVEEDACVVPVCLQLLSAQQN